MKSPDRPARPPARALRAAACLLVGLLQAAPLAAQAAPPGAARADSALRWNDAAADSLVARATARRALQLADSTLLSYTADAHGFLAFLGQLGEGTIIPPKVIQSEELALRLAWWQPNGSAQQLVGRRDTTLVPAEVGYYRDRYRVVLDNLPDRIRLGDGQDVADVPHPLAAGARPLYEYARAAPLRIRIPGREIIVDEVRFRPRNGATPAAIGSVFLDRETGAVVRLSMTFTRAAILDTRIESLALTLENTLVRERYWLPRRQEVEVSRQNTWLDLPVRGIVRGRWEISHYDVNERIPVPTRQLPSWSSVPADSLRRYRFPDRVVDVLPPDIQVAAPEDVAAVRAQAEQMVRAAMLAPPTRTAASGRGISDAARFTRSEGLALGAGLAQRIASTWLVTARARYGFADHTTKGQLALVHTPPLGREPLFSLFVESDTRDLASAERGGVTNSLAALAFGSDYTLQSAVLAAGITWRTSRASAFTWRLAYEQETPLVTRARPWHGTFGPPAPVDSTTGVRLGVQGRGGWVPGDVHTTRGQWELGAALGGVFTSVGTVPAQISGRLELLHPLTHDRAFVSITSGGAAAAVVPFGRSVPAQWLMFAGGPWSAPGYDPGTFAGQVQLSQRFELRQPVPSPAIPLGKFGTAPGHVTLAPFVQVLATDGRAGRLGARPAGLYPSVGTGVLFFFDLLRLDVAKGLRRGDWRVGFDIDRAFWGIL